MSHHSTNDRLPVAAPLDVEAALSEIERLHSGITTEKNPLADAVRCGELLVEIQKSGAVAKGQWTLWLRANLTVHPTTAFGYMRLYRYRDQVEGKYTGIDPALQALSRSSLTPEAKAEINRLRHDEGMSLDDIARLFGVRKSTVHYHTSEKQRNRIKAEQRVKRAQADRALEREQEASAIRKITGPTSQTYSLVRRAEQALDIALRAELTYEQRQALLEAQTALYRAEDSLVQASKRGAA